MVLSVRNVDYWMGSPLINHVERMHNLTDALAVGCALDIRLAQHRNPLSLWVEQLNNRLAVAYVYDLTEDGRPKTPAGEEWPEWLAPFKKTRLKCLVISAAEGQSDSEIKDGCQKLQEIFETI